MMPISRKQIDTKEGRNKRLRIYTYYNNKKCHLER